MMHEDDIYWLLLLPDKDSKSFSTRRANGIITHCYQDLKITLKDFFELPAENLENEFQLKPEEMEMVQQAKLRLTGQAFLLESLENHNIRILRSIDPEYPIQLKNSLHDGYPPLLFYLGDLSMFQKKIVAIIGSRDAHPLSLEFSHKSAACLASQKIVIVSGFAKGVDQEAYSGALEGGGQTIVVLAEGILSAKSAARKIASSIEDGQVMVLSQFHPNTRWMIGTAMARNKVVVGLADAILVGQVETEADTWEGAKTTLKLQKPLFIFTHPGVDLTGANQLIAKDAKEIQWDEAKQLEQLLQPILNPDLELKPVSKPVKKKRVKKVEQQLDLLPFVEEGNKG